MDFHDYQLVIPQRWIGRSVEIHEENVVLDLVSVEGAAMRIMLPNASLEIASGAWAAIKDGGMVVLSLQNGPLIPELLRAPTTEKG